MGGTVENTGFSAKVTDIDKVTVSVTVLSDIFGVTDSRVRQMAREGIVERAAKGRYNLKDSLKNYILALKVAGEGSGIADLDSDINIDEGYAGRIPDPDSGHPLKDSPGIRGQGRQLYQGASAGRMHRGPVRAEGLRSADVLPG